MAIQYVFRLVVIEEKEVCPVYDDKHLPFIGRAQFNHMQPFMFSPKPNHITNKGIIARKTWYTTFEVPMMHYITEGIQNIIEILYFRQS